MKVTQVALAVALLAVSAAASAQTVTYTTAASFIANVAPGAYTEGFADPAFSGDPSATFFGNGFSYDVAAAGGLYGAGVFIGSNSPNVPLTVTFTGAPVTAVGGDFYVTNFSDAFQAVPVTITLSDNTSLTFTPTSAANSFRGFTSSVPITSLTLGAPGASLYVGMDNLTVGVAAPIPEPGTWLMMAMGVGALLLRKRQRNGQA